MENNHETVDEHQSDTKTLSSEIMSVKGTVNGQPALWIGHISQLRNCPLSLYRDEKTGNSAQ